MAIRSRNRRHITVAGTPYLWWIAEDLEHDFRGTPMITLASKDRSLFVRYGLAQPDDRRHLLVLGPLFRGLRAPRGPWRRFRCPDFVDGPSVTPRHIARLVTWCTTPGPSPIEVTHDGLALPAP